MRKPLLITTLALAALAPVLPSRAAAQHIPSPYRDIETTQSAGAFVGYLLTDSRDPEIGPRAAPLFGARYSVRFGGPATGEVIVGFAPTDRRIFENIAPAGSEEVELVERGTKSVSLLIAEAGVRFNLTGTRTWNGIQPFVIGFAGIAGDLSSKSSTDLPENQIVDFGPSFAVGVGAGAEWFVTQKLSLRLDVQDHIWRLKIPEGLRGQGEESGRWTNNLGLSIGTALHF